MTSHTINTRHGALSPEVAESGFFMENGYTPSPRLVQWMTTAQCPLACPHCLAADGKSAAPEMDIRDAARLIEQVAEMGVKEFLLTGGEPTARPDLPEVINVLRANGVRYSINTAISPHPALRRTMEKYPPAFAAVSLDGPERIHDAFRGRRGAFRGALDSISFYTSLLPSDMVAAGTTVTSVNYRSLGETFGIVIESGAGLWGIHLPVPEGRAEHRPDLFLGRKRLRNLMKFVVEKRNFFPVTMADEMGYCGSWEPLLRDGPFFCGAGRTQCVVLPDGEVVPCTTTGRSVIAGNVKNQPLADIWRDGFSYLRNWQPSGRCGRCEYASACGGGCWLQRKHGNECYKDVWRLPVVSKAVLAVCLGLAASGLPAYAQEQAPAPERMEPPATKVWSPSPGMTIDKKQILQELIVFFWYGGFDRGNIRNNTEILKARIEQNLSNDPAGVFLLNFVKGERPDDLRERASAIMNALETDQRSLCFISSIAWRDIVEYCLDGKPAAERTDEERLIMRELMEKMSKTAHSWRTEILTERLDPFLHREYQYERMFITKAGPPQSERIRIEAARRRSWMAAREEIVQDREITEAFLDAHPYAESMRLHYEIERGEGLKVLRGGQEMEADGVIEVFDILIVPEEGLDVVLKFPLGRPRLDINVPAGGEYTYGDIIRLVCENNRKELRSALFASYQLYTTRGMQFEPMNRGLDIARRHYELKEWIENENEDAERRERWIRDINRQLLYMYAF